MTPVFDTKSRCFTYRDHSLYVEDLSVQDLIAQYGSPLYVYSQKAILDILHQYTTGLDDIPHLVAFAVKANGSLAILNRLSQEGAGADLTSGGELYLSLKAGIPGSRMIYSGVGKTDQEIHLALQTGILMFNVESEPELDRIAELAKQTGKIAPIAVRVNPNIDPKTHPKISTGLKGHKFGIPVDQAKSIYKKAAKMDSIRIVGIASHIGSSLMDTAPLLQALDLLLEFRQDLINQGMDVPYLDIGGGLGIQYESHSPEKPFEYAKKLKERVKHAGVTLVLEPGRSIVGNAGLLLCQVTFVKRNEDKIFVVVDVGMNSLARPAIYGAYHDIIPASTNCTEFIKADVVGPICESSDVFGKDRSLPPCKTGDILAICSAGAYGYAMSSNYNGQLRPAEVLVEGNQHRLIRQRETYEDLLRGQIL